VKDKRLSTPTETQKILFKCKNETIYCEGGQTLKQVAQRGYRISLLGDTQTTTGHSPGKLLACVIKDNLITQKPKGRWGNPNAMLPRYSKAITGE